ncbi:MAG: type II toxin-antitoxin system Phd/YefM family antitoxin [Armatimonadota bacterium]
MINLTNSHSLTDFQRNAKGFIDGLNETKEPVLLTVNGKVQAVLVDPSTYQAMESKLEKERFLGAIREGLKDIEEGRSKPAELVIAELSAKYDL